MGSTVVGRRVLIAAGAVHHQETLNTLKTGWDTNLTLLIVSIENPSCRGSQELSWSGWFHRPGDGQVALLPGLSCSIEQKGTSSPPLWPAWPCSKDSASLTKPSTSGVCQCAMVICSTSIASSPGTARCKQAHQLMGMPSTASCLCWTAAVTKESSEEEPWRAASGVQRDPQ